MKSDWLLLGMTAVIGLICGLWLYTTVFVPEYVHNPYIAELKGDEVINEINIIAEMYGECEQFDDCIAFEIRNNGSYRFADGNNPIMAGKLSARLLREARAIITEDALASAARDSGIACPRNDVEYVYDVYRNGTFYRLDTCATTITTEPAVSRMLGNFFNAIDMDLYAQSSSAEEDKDKTPILRRPTEVLFGATTTAKFENRQTQEGEENFEAVNTEIEQELR